MAGLGRRGRWLGLAAVWWCLTCTDAPNPLEPDGTEVGVLAVVGPPGVVSRWSFDEGSGTTAADGVGSNDGTLLNGPQWVGGQIDGAVSFDGVDDYVEVPDDPSLDITGDLTIAAWVNPRGLGQNNQGRIVDKASEDGTVGYVFRLNTGNGFGFQQHGRTSGVDSPSNLITLNTWQHVAVVVSGGRSVTLYLNGASVQSGTLTGAIAANSKPLHIGLRHDGLRAFDGMIDEVRIYGDALTPAEIAALYQEATPPPPPLPPMFAFGDRVQTTGNLSVRSAPSSSGTVIGAQSTGSAGTIVGGPSQDGSAIWWQVDYDDGSDGWSVQAGLEALPYPDPDSGRGWRSLVAINAPPTSTEKSTILARTGIDWDLLRVARDYSESLAPSDVLVIRNGWIAGEWGSTVPQGVASVTKSLTALAMARLMDLSDAGQLPRTIGLQSLAYQYLPAAFGDSDPLKQQIRIEHLMAMSSGIRPADPDNLTEQERLAYPMDAAPESEWVYSSLPPNLLSMILQGVSGQTLGTFFNTEIASRIGAASLSWQALDGGYTTGAQGVRTTARDLARIAYLTLQHGVWDEGSGPREIVSPARVAALTSPVPSLANTTFRESPGSPFPVSSDAPNHYGYLWWTNSTQVALGPSVPADAYYMHGCSDNLVIVVPSRNLIVVRLAESGPCSEPSFRSGFMQRIMAAIVQ